MAVRLLIADDHALVREGFAMILGAESALEVVGEARDGEEAVAQATRLRPDVVLMDIEMPELDGVGATRAIHVIAAGEALLAPSVTRRLIEDFGSRAERATQPPAFDELTAREAEVLGLVARGLSNAEIADRLVVSHDTVKTHVARILMKLGLRDRVQAVVLAYETGLLRPGDGAARG